ncbi:CcoQ/FixQ family Cbb3-type cytochrome c oxidase assembly chaperone [Rhodobacterales bacterium HKCCE3408]|nr:CcoQ/FixQ family Cbb3-type cytochrome c oxidase assembly chaperone [Rhodobacterales bacterium HKCCE3408]
MHDTYTFMRHFADSWALLALFVFFLGAFVWVWRPGSRVLHDAAAQSIFRNDQVPADDTAPQQDPQGATRGGRNGGDA